MGLALLEKKSPRDDITGGGALADWCWLLVEIGVGWLKILVLVACTADWCWCGDVARAEPPPQDLVNACA